MKISDAGLQIIKNFTGFRPSAVSNMNGECTIGYNSRYINFVTKQPPKLGMVISKEQGTKLLLDELAPIEQLVTILTNVEISQNMFDALCCLTHGVGETTFRKSFLLHVLNLKKFEEAADSFLLMSQSSDMNRTNDRLGGIEIPAIRARRIAERNLFLQGLADLKSS